MEAKSIDNLLNELNNVQLSKESMSGISGGYTICHTTKTGSVDISYHDNGRISEIRLNGCYVFSYNITGNGDNVDTEAPVFCGE